MAEAPWTVGRLLEWTEKFLREKSIESPRLDAQILLAHVLKCPRAQLYVRFDFEPAEPERTHFRELIRQRVDGVPVAYLVGSKEFFLLSFEVSPSVLVPRPATETLVTTALDAIQGIESPTLLDVGTGSGCIAIAIAARNIAAGLVAIDISDEAIAIASRNAAKLGVADRIELRKGDLYSAVRADERFDVIVSNPPYIPSGDIGGLGREVRDHEPRLALDGGADGLAVIDRLISGASERLKPGGWLHLEIGIGQDATVRARLEASTLKFERIVKDADGIARVVTGRSR